MHHLLIVNKYFCDYAANRCAQVPVVQHAVPDTYLAIQESVIHYTCIDGFVSSALYSLSTACDGINWMPPQPPGCKGAKCSGENSICLLFSHKSSKRIIYACRK